MKEYLRWRQGWPSAFACMSDMDAETAEAFEYCLLVGVEDDRNAAAMNEVSAIADLGLMELRAKLGI